MELFINTPGAYLHVKDQMFEVRIKQEGEAKKQHFAAKKVSSIQLANAAALSTDAIFLAMQHHIDIVFVRFDGMPYGRVWHTKLGSTTKIRKRQLEASLGKEGLDQVKKWLELKLRNQADFLRELCKHRPKREDYLRQEAHRIEGFSQKIISAEAETVSQVAESIRGWEGSAGRLYFGALSKSLPKVHRFKGRSSRPAVDPFNAFLNYGYGMLYGKVEKTLILAGLDPYVGFLHRDDYNQKSLVFDAIEPYRIYVERIVFRLFSGKKINKNHTDIIPNGLRLNAAGKEILVTTFTKYMQEDKIRYKGRNQTRQNAIQMDAHRFANNLIETA